MRENFTLYIVPFSCRLTVLINSMLREKGERGYAISSHIDEDSSDRILKIAQELPKALLLTSQKKFTRIAHYCGYAASELSRLFYD